MKELNNIPTNSNYHGKSDKEEIIAKAHKIFFDKTGIEISVSINKALRDILKANQEEFEKTMNNFEDSLKFRHSKQLKAQREDILKKIEKYQPNLTFGSRSTDYEKGVADGQKEAKEDIKQLLK